MLAVVAAAAALVLLLALVLRRPGEGGTEGGSELVRLSKLVAIRSAEEDINTGFVPTEDCLIL